VISLVAVDPGKSYCGIALYVDGLLVDADVLNTSARTPEYALAYRQGSMRYEECCLPIDVAHAGFQWVFDRVGSVDEYVCEWMQYYDDEIKRNSKPGAAAGQAKDLLFLTATAAAIGAVLTPTRARFFLPREWKGTVNADVFLDRIVKTFKVKSEIQVIEDLKRKHKKNAHHGIEAAGIGLYAQYRK